MSGISAADFSQFVEKVETLTADEIYKLWTSGKCFQAKKQIIISLGAHFMNKNQLNFFENFENDFKKLRNSNSSQITNSSTKNHFYKIPSVLMTRIWSFLDLFQIPEIAGVLRNIQIRFF